MNLLRTGSRVLLLALVVLTGVLGVAPSRTAAQAGATSFTSPMTGIPIQTSAPWTIDTASVLSQDGVESITIDGEYEFMQVWFLPGDVDLVEARDVVLDSFAQTFGAFVEIDRGAYGNVSYSLDITSAEGVEFGVFSLFLGQRDSGYVEYYVFFGPLSLFAQGLTSAQEHVTVNGTAVFGGVDGTGLQNLLLANAGVTSSSTTMPTEPPSVPTQLPVQPTRPPAQPTQPPVQPTQEPVEAATETTGTGSADGVAYLQTIADETQAVQASITSFGEGALLVGSSNSAEQDQGVDMVDDAVSYWGTYDQVAAGIVAPAGYEEVDAAYRQLATDVVSLAALFEAWLDAPDASADAASDEFWTALDTVQTEIAALQQMVGTGSQMADQPQDTGGNITETGQRDQRPQDPGLNEPQDTGSTADDSEVDLGLVSDGRYVSPQLGVTITWDHRWTFDSEYIEDAIGSNEDTGEDWITLVWTTGTNGDITMSVTEAGDVTPADAVSYWKSDEYLSQFDLPSEVVLSDASDDRGGVVIRVDDGEDGLVLYREAICLSRRCDEVAYVMIISAVDDTADILADAEEGIEIEGEPATGVFSTREISRALDQQ